ncbi:LOW QUALITY PROTEIN: hypothetical protein KUTeg_017082 [Tegillarca granosa]|uniref:KY-like immunoglobulin-like domain-containing protein n=1 Tax=Tegillarca granosa TaxID=220873 RepID=A0ABQ9ESI3_TEGGR|nr:LOW QUALITY PROTEIN: hypothetical protein KUTeg_017082 [Tegillarca granosa]
MSRIERKDSSLEVTVEDYGEYLIDVFGKDKGSCMTGIGRYIIERRDPQDTYHEDIKALIKMLKPEEEKQDEEKLEDKNENECKRKGLLAKAIKRARSVNFDKKLDMQILVATRVLNRLNRIEHLSKNVLQLNQNVLTEMKQYPTPPTGVHQEWRTCKKFLYKTGKENIMRRIVHFDPRLVNKEVAYTASSLIKSFTVTEIRDVSRGAAVFYAPNSLLRKTWWDLIDYLTDNDSFDTLAKIRTIFRWITSYDIENFEIGESPPANSPLEYFGKIQSDMGDYANLFFILCSVAHCVVIDGITKSTAYDVGEPMNKDNMKAHWNAVYVKKEWRLVDCFWASTHFVDEGNATRNDKNRFTKVTTYTKLEDDDGDQEVDEIHNEEPNEFYFFTDPDKLINTHLPRDPKWQLLVKPISDQEFEEQAYLRERFLKMEIKITNEKFDKCKIIAKDGEARVQFRLPPERSPFYRFKYLLYKSDRYGDTNKKIDTVLDRFIIFQHTKERLKLSLRFPVAGKFQLDIFGMDKENFKLFDLLCTYVFECNVPVSDCYPLPDNPMIGWGPGVDSEAFDVVPITHPDAIIVTEDGKLEIRIQGNKELALYMTLKNPFISNGNLTKYAMLRWRDGEYIINTRLPKEGEYALNLYARDQDGKKQSYNVMNYLLKCIGKEIKEKPYPNLAQENLGAHPEAEALGVKCIGCEDGFVEAKEGKAKVEFQTRDDLQLLCELHANDIETPERLRVAPNIVNGRQAFALDLPLEGEYAMNVFGLLKNNPQKIHNIHALLVHSGGRPIQEGTKRRTGTGTKNFWKDIGQMDIEVINTKDSEVIVPVPFGVPNVVAFLERKGSGQPPSSKNVEIIKEEGVPLYKLKLEEYGEYTFNIYQRDEGVFIRNFMRYIIRRNLKDNTAVENDLDVIMSTIKEERIKEGYDVSGIDSRKEDFIEHKKQRVDVGQKVAAARQLQKMMDTKDPEELKKAMNEYKDASKTKSGVMDDPLLASANKQYKTIKAKYDLTSAYQNRELTDLDKAIAQAKKAKDPSLDVQILLAQRLRERIAVMRRIRDTVMKTDPKTINEIRKYNTPPDGAHQSIAAALLLTGSSLKDVEVL